MSAASTARLHRSLTVHPYGCWGTVTHTPTVQINDIGGLPAHPLIVHLPVVLVPLATIGAGLMLARPSWRRALGIPTAVLAVIAAFATQLAVESGESLEDHVRRSELIETHAHIAEQARPWIFLFAVVMVAVVVWDLVQRRRVASVAPETDERRPPVRSVVARGVVVLTVVGLLLGVGATVGVYRAGHSGAKATWHDVGHDEQREGG